MHKIKERAAHHARRLGEKQKIRFILAGITNTLVDVVGFNIFILLFAAHVVPASIASTTIAMAVSYLLNKKAVFRNKQPHHAKQIFLFLLVTLSGIWVIQTLIMVEVLHVLENTFDPQSQTFLLWFLQNVAKGAGIVFGAVWNYLGYSRLVFREKS